MNKCPFSNFIQRDESVRNDSKERTHQYNILIENSFPAKEKVEGLFGPGSMHWKIYRSPSMIFGAYSALLLQIAHPAVADGVAQFSQFSKDYLGRAERTFTSMIKIYFGDQKIALQSGRKLHHIHNLIRGKIQVNKNGTVIEEDYCANDPKHLCWVQATLVATSIQVYEMVVRELSGQEKERFFQESKITAKVMGIPSDEYPQDYAAFQRYYNRMINGNYLRVDKTTRDLAKVIFDPPHIPGSLAKLFAAGLLPFHFRTEFDLKYNTWQKKLFNFLIRIAAIILWLIPSPLGFTPPYYQAHYRIAIHKGLRPTWSTQFFNYLCSFRIFKSVRL